MAGKRVLAENIAMRDVRRLIIMPSGEGLNSLNKSNRAEFSGKKKDSKPLRSLRIREKNLKSNLVYVVVLFLESKTLARERN